MSSNAPLTSYTVTIAGPERHDGEKPYTYVIDAISEHDAVAKVAATMANDFGETDLKFVSIAVGVPTTSCGYYWNDLRQATVAPNAASSSRGMSRKRELSADSRKNMNSKETVNG